MDINFDSEELARRLAIAYASWAAGFKGMDRLMKQHRQDTIGDNWLLLAQALIDNPPNSLSNQSVN